MPSFVIDLERLGDRDAEYVSELQHRVRTDFFFCAPLLGFHDFHPRIHAEVAEFYPKKCPGVPLTEWDPIHKRMHLDPRLTFKTSAGIVDQYQTIVTDANVTICNETATKDLAKAVTQRIARAFYRPKNKQETILQQIFPDYTVDKLRATYRAPNATRDEIEPTLYATSVDSSQSGWHPWILNPDDMVDTKNSGIEATDASRLHVWNVYQTNLNTLRIGGYLNIRGTRYHPFDLYGKLLNVIDLKEWKTIIRSSLRVKSGERLVEGEFPKEDEVELIFPEILSYEKLKGIFREDYRSFMCQQQNDPSGGGVAVFPSYAQCMIQEERVPTTGEIRICWRVACDSKEYMKNYSEGAAVLYQGSRVYVVDAWRGVYTMSELATRIARGCKLHQCGELTIEQTPGSEAIIPHIRNEATRQNWFIRIERPDYEPDDAKRTGRCKQLEPLQKAGRFWVSKASGQLDEMRNQFANFGLIAQNGLVDTISRLALKWPTSVLAGEITPEQREMYKMASERSMFEVIYGKGGMVEVQQSVADAQTPAPPTNSYGLTPMLGGLDG